MANASLASPRRFAAQSRPASPLIGGGIQGGQAEASIIAPCSLSIEGVIFEIIIHRRTMFFEGIIHHRTMFFDMAIHHRTMFFDSTYHASRFQHHSTSHVLHIQHPTIHQSPISTPLQNDPMIS